MKKSGFTLVELLVVISIIAVLSVIGLTIFGDVQKKNRDARRKADINSIADAMEANYGKTTAGQYNGLVTTMFSSGEIPTDPTNTNAATDAQCPGVCKYCVAEGTTAQTRAACTIAIVTAKTVGVGFPAGGTSSPYWMVCANLEGTAGTFYCRSNLQ